MVLRGFLYKKIAATGIKKQRKAFVKWLKKLWLKAWNKIIGLFGNQKMKIEEIINGLLMPRRNLLAEKHITSSLTLMSINFLGGW